MGDEDAVCAAIKRVQDVIGGAGWSADENGEAARARGHYAGINIAPIKWGVFGIDANAV